MFCLLFPEFILSSSFNANPIATIAAATSAIGPAYITPSMPMNFGKIRINGSKKITCLVSAPAHKTGTPVYTIIKSIPAPVRSSAFVSNLRLCYRYNSGVISYINLNIIIVSTMSLNVCETENA